MDKKKIFEKWGPILGDNSDKKSWFDEYDDFSKSTISSNMAYDTSNANNFPSLLPIAVRVASQTLGQDLVSVQPLSGLSQEEMAKIKSINRERKIESIIEDKEYVEMKPEDHPDYRRGPSSDLFYLDYEYKSSGEEKDKKI